MHFKELCFGQFTLILVNYKQQVDFSYEGRFIILSDFKENPYISNIEKIFDLNVST